MAVDLEMAVNTLVTAGLHPQNVASLEDYDDDTKGELAQVVTAFDEAYQGIIRVHDARKAAASDPTLTEAAQLIRTQEMSDKVFQRAAGALDRAMSNMKSGIGLLELQLSTPVNTEAAGTYGREIREHVKAMKAEGKSPMNFVRQAIENGDHTSVAAVLGAPPYLSGIDAETQAVLTRMYREKHNPVAAKRLRAMQAARDLIFQRSGLLFTELEKAVGAPPHKVKALREAKTKADKAFNF